MWFQKGKNLFNINDIVTSVYIDTNGAISNSSVSNTSGFIKVSKGNLTLSYEYTTLLNVGARAYVFYDNNKSVLSGGTYLNSNKITKLSCPQDGYVRFSYDKNVNNIQLEYGNDKTAYEAYIEPKIFIKNDNNIYEEFTKKQEENYSEQERIIGTWINGKPLYRKVGIIKFTSIYTQGSYTTGSLISTNIQYATITKVFSNSTATNNLYNTFDSTIKSNIYVSASDGYIYGFTTRNDYLNRDIYVVVEYTKTTD